MSKLPRITGKEMVAALQRGGFSVVRITGSHHHLHRPGSGLVTVPVHPGEVLSPMLVKSILEQAGLTVDNLRELL